VLDPVGQILAQRGRVELEINFEQQVCHEVGSHFARRARVRRAAQSSSWSACIVATDATRPEGEATDRSLRQAEKHFWNSREASSSFVVFLPWLVRSLSACSATVLRSREATYSTGSAQAVGVVESIIHRYRSLRIQGAKVSAVHGRGLRRVLSIRQELMLAVVGGEKVLGLVLWRRQLQISPTHPAGPCPTCPTTNTNQADLLGDDYPCVVLCDLAPRSSQPPVLSLIRRRGLDPPP